MNQRAPEHSLPLFLLAVALIPAFWQAQGVVWVAPWCLTFGLYFVSALLGVLSVWFMVGWAAWRPSLAEILLGAAVAVFMIAVGEGLARLATSPPDVGTSMKASASDTVFLKNDRFGWQFKPNQTVEWRQAKRRGQYRIGQDGFRTVTSTLPVPRSGPRPTIVFAGGDLTFGSKVASTATFAARTAAALGYLPQNVGMPGFNLHQVLHVIQDNLAPPPHAIVVAFADPTARANAAAPLSVRGWPRPAYSVTETGLHLNPPPSPSPVFDLLSTHSQLWAVLWRLDEYLGRFVDWGDASLTRRRVLVRMYRAAKAAKVPILFVRLPAPNAFDHPSLQDTFHTVGARYVDLGRADIVRPPRLLLPNSPYLTPEGHAWVAREIRAPLRRLLDD